jgi:hypothetical protein
MYVEWINLHCSTCEPSQFVLLKRDEVEVTLDLNQDQHEFRATCDKCGGSIYNTRRMGR